MTVYGDIESKFTKNTDFVSNFIKLFVATSINKVLPVNEELYDIESKINKCNTAFTDNEDDDDVSTLALTSNPSSFSSNESAEEYFKTAEYNFDVNKFEKISILGSGSFGTVFLSYYDKQLYAIKSILKNKINNNTEVAGIMSEKEILMEMNSPYIVKLYGTCQTKNELWFITEALENGDLYQAIYDGEKLSHEECVFYGAGIIMGINYIHSKNIAYRDLKPENIMISENGYPKIIDFGLSKKTSNNNKCTTLCGTPEYASPEIILNNGHDNKVDIWAFGVVLYEMICRTTPFCNKKTDFTQLFTNIIHCGKNGIDLPKKIDNKTDGTSNARNLISQLLSGNKETRLGHNNIPEVLLEHPYFLSTAMNKAGLIEQTYIPPIFQPTYIGRDINTLRTYDDYSGDQTLFKNF